MISFEAGTNNQRKVRNRDDNMIPVINMTFLLLLFFIVAGSFYETFAKEILPPHSSSESPASSLVEEFVLMPNGDLHWRNGTTTVSRWRADLQAAGELPPAAVRVRADGDTPAALVIPLLDEFKQSSVRRVALVTVKARSGEPINSRQAR